jgi:hypothetical protein
MGLIKEPKGVDLIVGPSTLTQQDRQVISEIIAIYKLTGKLPSKLVKGKLRKRRKTSSEKSSVSS